ncbi:sensor histidine kinase [Gorillibacterium timonense]|uniref:sensor histidine kinase n=1 Tax=Gorillibacterium timonense TaxID=1689269 RepID=UPI00071DF121|nr:HAMP domain-containing sensor histidine kinase [Gorillibacterium timonense]
MDRRIKRSKLTSILTYWTVRYFIILCVGFTVIAVSSLYWIRATATDSRLKTAGLLGQEIADNVVSDDGRLVIPSSMERLVASRLNYFNFQGELCLFIADRDGKLLFSMPGITQEQLAKRMNEDLTKVREPGTEALTTPVMAGDQRLGQVTLLLSKRSLAASPHEVAIVCVLLATLILSGWLTLYLLSRKLARPIRQVAEGANLIRSGQYDIRLDVKTKEREIQELVDSFGDMASRLKQLEEWRTLSLAGVTHELKTPVTSIKGLLLAVRDDVVPQEEAKEFLDIALQESGRLERMVSDLLDYNAMSAGSVKVASERLELRALVSEIVYQWGLTNKLPDAAVSLDLPHTAVYGIGDALRVQQILVNLLNNARQAVRSDRAASICVRVVERGNQAFMDVADNGTGISPEEAPHIFERFYRGERKKLRTRGLGLGLTYSQLLARAQGGELSLVSSSSEGSVFRLALPKAASHSA